MTPEVTSYTPETPLPEIARLLETRRIKRVPVLRDGELVGIVSRADLLRGFALQPSPTPTLTTARCASGSRSSSSGQGSARMPT